MLDVLQLRCDRNGCDRPLDEGAFRLAYRTEGTERRVYECACGALTITIGRHGEAA